MCQVWLRQSSAVDCGVVVEDLGLKLVSVKGNNTLAGGICPQVHSHCPGGGVPGLQCSLVLNSACFFCRHQQESDFLGAYSDTDLHRHRKKKKKKKRHSRKSEDLMKDVEMHLPKSSSYEAVGHFRRTEGTFLLADGLPVEDSGSLREKTKHLRMESRPDRCHLSEYGQGKKMGNYGHSSLSNEFWERS